MESFVWLGVDKDIKEVLKFYKNELRLWFHCTILIPRKCPPKTLFQHTVPPSRWTIVDILHNTYTLFHVTNRGLSTDHLPTSSCPRSYWMTPDENDKSKVFKIVTR